MILEISKKELKDDFNSLYEAEDFAKFNLKQRNLQ